MQHRRRLCTSWALSLTLGLGLALCGAGFAQNDSPSASTPRHSIGAHKLVVDDLMKTQRFYETLFGMKEVMRYDDTPDVFEETILAFDTGARLALMAPNDKVEQPLAKDSFPVLLFLAPDFDALTKAIEAAGHPLRRYGDDKSSPLRIAIVPDPSGNLVEIVARPDAAIEVGGSKLIVDDRQKAEDFYVKIFGAKAGRRYVTDTYDEVIMSFGEGPILALFQPKLVPQAPKSRFAVTVIYTSEFDAVLQRITAEGLGYRDVKTTDGTKIIVAQDPSHNAIEIISR